MLTALNEDVPGFKAIRHLAIRFQSLLRHHNETNLDQWLDDAKDCGIPAVANFARSLMIDPSSSRTLDRTFSAMKRMTSSGIVSSR